MPKSPNDRRHFIIAGALVAISTVVLNFLLSAALPMPVQASLESITIDRMIGWHVTIISFLFSLIVVFMLYSIVVFRKREDDDAEGVHFEGNTMLEIAWTIVPLVLVLVFTFYGINALTTVTRAESDELAIKVTGFQWAWTFEYPEGFISQELVLPVQRRARMELTSTDVLHSFWIPEMRVKQDLVPGQETVVRFTPIEVGEYRLRCAELCGLTHWNMLAPVRVVEQAEYDQWIQQMASSSSPAIVQVDDIEAVE